MVVAFLEGKKALQKLIRETITETEFSDTLWFLAIIFIILPVLPTGEYGPFGFFAPRRGVDVRHPHLVHLVPGLLPRESSSAQTEGWT